MAKVSHKQSIHTVLPIFRNNYNQIAGYFNEKDGTLNLTLSHEYKKQFVQFSINEIIILKTILDVNDKQITGFIMEMLNERILREESRSE